MKVAVGGGEAGLSPKRRQDVSIDPDTIGDLLGYVVRRDVLKEALVR